MCRALIYFEHFLIFFSIVSVCALICVFASLVGIAVGSASSPIGLKICAITAEVNFKELEL